ncbi:hypothetical protein KEM52_005166, partial [Ascosphaera acerosa]
LRYLDDLGLLDDSYPIPRSTKPSVSATKAIPPALAAVAHVLALPAEKAATLRARGKQPKPTLGQAETRGLRRAIARRRADYAATTLAADEQALAAAAPAPGGREYLALKVRVGEKQVLAQAEAALQAHLEELEGAAGWRSIG